MNILKDSVADSDGVSVGSVKVPVELWVPDIVKLSVCEIVALTVSVALCVSELVKLTESVGVTVADTDSDGVSVGSVKVPVELWVTDIVKLSDSVSLAVRVSVEL